MNRKRKSNKLTFTKVAVIILLIFGLVNSTLPYVLAIMGREPVTDLGTAWLAEVIGVFAVYAIKAYFETKQEAKQALEDRKQEFLELKEGSDLNE